MKRGSQRWIVQTYARLRAAGLDCELVSRAPRQGTIVFHNGHKTELRRQLRHGADVTLVGIRGDRREALLADFEVLQNGLYADDRRRFFVPYWPQPGLVARDPARGDRITRAAFKGFDNNLHPSLRGAEWAGFLRSQGIEWVTDSMSHATSEDHRRAGRLARLSGGRPRGGAATGSGGPALRQTGDQALQRLARRRACAARP